jgi:hypothetical protein
MEGTPPSGPADDFLKSLSTGAADVEVPTASSPTPIQLGGFSRRAYEKEADKWRARKRLFSLRTCVVITLAAAWLVGTASCVYEWLQGALVTELLARFGSAFVGAGVGGVFGFAAGILGLLYLQFKLRRMRISDEYFPVAAFSVGVLGTVLGAVAGVGSFHVAQRDWYLSLRALRNVPAEQREAAYMLQGAGVKFDLESDRIVRVHCEDMAMTGVLLENMSHLTDVEHIQFINVQVADHGLNYLNTLPALSSMKFHRCRLNERSLRGLSKLRPLRVLVLNDVGLAKGSVEWLGKLTQLEYLALSSWSDSRFECAMMLPQLQKLPSLRSLDLTGRMIDDPTLLDKFRADRPGITIKTGPVVIGFAPTT